MNGISKMDETIPIATTIKTAGTPNANGKQEFCPKHWTSSRRIGVTKVESSDPALIEM